MSVQPKPIKAENNSPRMATKPVPAQHPARADANRKVQEPFWGTDATSALPWEARRLSIPTSSFPAFFPLEWNSEPIAPRPRHSTVARSLNAGFAFASRFDLKEDQLTYHATDGRSHSYPLPKVQGHHYDPIESVVIARASKKPADDAVGHESQEHYQCVGDQFRLTSIVLRV